MKYGLICLLALCLSLDASAGFFKKTTKGIGSVLDPEAAEQTKKEAVVAGNEAEQQRSNEVKGVDASRSGEIAYAPASIQWGDSVRILKEICKLDLNEGGRRGFHSTNHTPGYSADYILYRYGFKDQHGRAVDLLVDDDVGLFEVNISFENSGISFEQLLDKYSAQFGKPVESSKEKGAIKYYCWNAEALSVELSAMFILGNATDAYLILSNPVRKSVVVKREEAEWKKSHEKHLKKKKAKTEAALNF